MSENWKKVENRTNKELGAKPEGHYRRGKECPDGVNDMFSYEYTNTSNKLAYVNKELEDAERHSRGGRIPVVIIFQKRNLRAKGIVCLRYEDWRALHGEG